MNEESIPPEVLRAFVFPKGDQGIFELLDRHPGLDVYVVPVIALMHAINSLMFVDRTAAEGQGERVLELSSLPGGGIAARVDDGSERTAGQYVSLMLSIARNCSQFLNERGYALLAALVEGQQDPAMQAKLQRYQQALRLCLDQGFDDEWLWKEKEEEERAMGYPEERLQTVREWFRMKDLLAAKTPEELGELLKESPWMQVYVEELPIDLAPEQQALYSALGAFCWGGSWHEKWRAVKSNPQILTPAAWQVLERIRELGLEHKEEHPVHSQIASRVRDDLKTLQQCAAEGADPVLLDMAARYVG